jgi:hypothetical protein
MIRAQGAAARIQSTSHFSQMRRRHGREQSHHSSHWRTTVTPSCRSAFSTLTARMGAGSCQERGPILTECDAGALFRTRPDLGAGVTGKFWLRFPSKSGTSALAADGSGLASPSKPALGVRIRFNEYVNAVGI